MKYVNLWSFLLGVSFTLSVWLLVKINTEDDDVVADWSPQVDRFIAIKKNIQDENVIGENSIFFIETHSNGVRNLDSHQACSIESAAFTYPEKKVYVLFLTDTHEVSLNDTSLIESLRQYRNIYFKYFNLVEFSKETPLESWILSEKLQTSKYLLSHTSDVVRYLTLYKYGGTYLDLDVIVVKHHNLSNYACSEDDKYVNGAILNFDTKRGREVASLCIEDLIENFDAHDWSAIGPLLMTRVFKMFCRVDGIKITDECDRFTLLPRKRCYALRYQDWEQLFQSRRSAQVMNLTKDSYYVHLWNKFSSNYRIKVTSDAAFINLAAAYCPMVFDSRRDYF